MDVHDEDNCPVKTIYFACSAVIYCRMYFNLDPEKDGEKMGTFSMTQITLPLCYADLLLSQYSTTLHHSRWIHKEMAFFPPYTCAFCSW